MRQLILLAAAVAIAFTAGCGTGNDVPPVVMDAMRRADRYELLSLDPARTAQPAAGHFHGWRVLGRTTIGDDATRTKLNDALRAGARDNSGAAAACFNPRHGIRAIRGDKTVDLVICFECLQVQVFEGDQPADGFLVSDAPQRVFDEVLCGAGVRLAEETE